MRKHPIDLTSLLAGLVFIGLAAVYLLAAASGNEVDASWVLPIALVALGLAGLVGGITRAVRRSEDSTVTPEPAESPATDAETPDTKGVTETTDSSPSST